ncbi:MAG: helix-turn-helix transcriptional regulator [Candidatus Sulfobium sp.]
MTSIARVLKQAIERAARKQVRSETESLRKASARYRKTVADLGIRMQEIERELTAIRRQLSSASAGGGQHVPGNHRFSAKGLQSLRKKLALSKTECGKLLGVSGRAVGQWESGLARPTEEQIRDIAAIRKIGKREVRMRLEDKGRKKK